MKSKIFAWILIIISIIFYVSVFMFIKSEITPDSYYIDNGYKQEIYCIQEGTRWILDE